MTLCSPPANPAIMAAEGIVGVVQGFTVELEVYVSGFPLPTQSSITWQLPDGTKVMSTDFGVTFQGGGRRLILSNVQPAQAGSYQCSVVISLSPYMGATTSIQLDVYGECVQEHNNELRGAHMLLLCCIQPCVFLHIIFPLQNYNDYDIAQVMSSLCLLDS